MCDVGYLLDSLLSAECAAGGMCCSAIDDVGRHTRVLVWGLRRPPALTARHHARDCLAVSLHAPRAPLATSTISLDAPEINTVALYKLIAPHNTQGERENTAR